MSSSEDGRAINEKKIGASVASVHECESLTCVAELATPAWITNTFPRFHAAAVNAARIRHAFGALRSRPSDATSALIRPIAESVFWVAVHRTGR